MKIIESSFEILEPKNLIAGIELLRKIEKLARISHRSEDRQTDDSYDRFLRFVVMSKGDWSVVEHASATVIFRVDRGVTHELVRHRLFSFTQESTRFVNYKKKGEIEFIRPDGISLSSVGWLDSLEHAEKGYLALLETGYSPQIARSVLPNALASTIAVTGNLRNWRAFFLQRVTKEAHPDFRRVVLPLLVEFQNRIPILYEDIKPEIHQIESLSRPR